VIEITKIYIFFYLNLCSKYLQYFYTKRKVSLGRVKSRVIAEGNFRVPSSLEIKLY